MRDYHNDDTAHAGKTGEVENAANLDRLERKTVTKLDLLLVPSMSILYLCAFLDRSNIGNARVAGLQTDLKITDIQYQTGWFVIAEVATA